MTRKDEGPQFYILDAAGAPTPVDLHTWARWIEDTHRRRVALDTLADGRLVVTTFVGFDNRVPPADPPELFVTLVYLAGEEIASARYATRAAALAGHARAVAGTRPEPAA